MKNKNYNPAEIFSDIYGRYYDKILRFFRKDFPPEDAEDLTQQTFLQLWSWIMSAPVLKSEKALIFRIAKNVRIDRFRKNAITIETALLPEYYEIADRKDEISALELRMCLNKLSVKDQQLLYMKIQGMSSEEIGRAFSISASAARTRLQKIKKKLNDVYDFN